MIDPRTTQPDGQASDPGPGPAAISDETYAFMRAEFELLEHMRESLVNLVNQRFKRSGSRWKERTGEHILQLRALALSERWDSAMQLLFEPLRKKVTAVEITHTLAA